MKRIIILCCIALIPFTFLSAYAQENKVVVIPLNSNRGPGDWKTVSVSAFAGMPELDTIQVRAAYLCGHRGVYAVSGSGTTQYLIVPVQLPDGATITLFQG